MSGRGAVEEVLVLGDRAGQDHEVDLPVVIDGDDTDHSDRLLVADEQHSSEGDLRRVAPVGQQSPSVAVVVLRIEVGDDIDLDFHQRTTLLAHR